MKKFVSVLLIFILILSLAGCGSSEKSAENDMALLVRGELDKLYLGRYDKDYMKLVSLTEEHAVAEYKLSMETAADHFIYYFQIEHPTEELRAEIAGLLKEIYAKAKYSIVQTRSLDAKSCLVTVRIEPMDLFRQVVDSMDTGMAAVWEKYDGVDISSLSEEEYKQFDADWAQAILSLVLSKMADIGYLEAETLEMKLELGEDGIWRSNDNDFALMDKAIIPYP